jgi:hypothetical protein
MRSIIIVLVCLVLSSCGKEITIETQKNGVVITALVNCSITRFNEKQYQVEGSLIIKNTINTAVPFSNKYLYLVSSKTEARAYMDSIASNVINFAAITITANSVFEEKVYWVVDSIDDVDVENIRLEWRN